MRLLGNKRKKLGERGLESIFLGNAEFSKTYRFYIIEPNDFIPVHTIMESRDAISMNIGFHPILDLKIYIKVILKRLIFQINQVLMMIK